MTGTASTIAILEDDEALRLYLESVIATTEGLKLGFSCGLVADALRASTDSPTALYLIDMKLPDGSGLDLVSHVKATTSSKCLILTVLGDRASVLLALRAGADGYLLKDTPPDLLRSNIFRTLRGETPISPQAATFLLEIWKASEPTRLATPTEDAITSREVEVLRLFSRGLSYREAADTLGISPHTIGDHVKAIYRKLGVHSRAEAIFEARQLGLISPRE